MNIVVFALIATVAIGVVIAMWRTWVHNNLLPSTFEANAATHPYHCVAIYHRDGACAAAKRLSGHRFLSREAPPIPLPACDVDRCRCRYVHFEDRRQNDERRNPRPALLQVGGYNGPERRSGEERRHLVTQDLGATAAMRG